MKQSKHIITWEQYLKDVKELADKLNDVKDITNHSLFPIPRGGLYIAAGLSYHLGAPVAGNLYCSSEYLIVVDDVSDTGKTLKAFKDGKRRIATLYRKDGTEVEPDFCVRTINEWIIFPWEDDDGSDRSV